MWVETVANESAIYLTETVCRKLSDGDFTDWLQTVDEFVKQVRPTHLKEVLPFYFPY